MGGWVGEIGKRTGTERSSSSSRNHMPNALRPVPAAFKILPISTILAANFLVLSRSVKACLVFRRCKDTGSVRVFPWKNRWVNNRWVCLCFILSWYIVVTTFVLLERLKGGFAEAHCLARDVPMIMPWLNDAGLKISCIRARGTWSRSLSCCVHNEFVFVR